MRPYSGLQALNPQEVVRIFACAHQIVLMAGREAVLWGTASALMTHCHSSPIRTPWSTTGTRIAGCVPVVDHGLRLRELWQWVMTALVVSHRIAPRLAVKSCLMPGS